MTSSPKSSMDVSASFVRNSVSTSFQKIAPACLKNVTAFLFQKFFVLIANIRIRSGQLIGNLPLINKRPTPGALESLFQIVRGHEHRLPVCHERLQPPPQKLRCLKVKTGEGFIQQQDLWIVQRSSRD